MSSKATLAVLIPCYNSALYLPELFANIRSQTVPFDEIICYDDCSTDNTADIILDEGIKLIRGAENEGAAVARNRMIEECSSEWIHFHDSDDLMELDYVESMKTVIAALPEEETRNTCLLSDILVTDRDTRSNNEIVKYRQDIIATDPVDYFLRNLGITIIGCYPKIVLSKINGFREDIRGNEDPDLLIRLANEGAKFRCLERPLVINLIRENSFSAMNWFRCMQDKLKCLENYAKILPKKYHQTIGKQAAQLSNYFYKERHPDLSRKARSLAYSLGIKQLDTSSFSKAFSLIFGLKFYLWIYRRRTDLNI